MNVCDPPSPGLEPKPLLHCRKSFQKRILYRFTFLDNKEFQETMLSELTEMKMQMDTKPSIDVALLPLYRFPFF